jgi:hemerythrin-like domain-containing protein
MPNTSFDHPLDLLAACHERIERELVSLDELQAYLAEHGCDARARSLAQDVLDYFDTAGEMHHKDEDDDLFPLVRRRAATQGRADVAAVIDELEREHHTMHDQWRRLRARLAKIAAGEGRLDSDELTKFTWLHRRHMEREAAVVMPFARQAFEPGQIAALGNRMAARRAA